MALAKVLKLQVPVRLIVEAEAEAGLLHPAALRLIVLIRQSARLPDGTGIAADAGVRRSQARIPLVLPANIGAALLV